MPRSFSRWRFASLLAVAVALILSSCRGERQETAPVPFILHPEIPLEQRIVRLDRFIGDAMRQAAVPGLSIALVHNGKLAWAKGYGVANSVTGRAVTPETPFEAASLGKVLTAYATLKLVEQERLDLDRPLSSYLSKQFVDDDRYRDQITGKMVLTHTSGLSNNFMESHHHVEFAPGSRFSYSGVGYMYLQRVIEQITGQPFNAFMTATFFTPLGMSSSSYFRSSCESRLSRGHFYIAGFAAPMPFFPLAQPNAANLLCSTATDLARFESELMNPTIVSPRLVKEMLSPQVHVDGDVWWGLGVALYRKGSTSCLWHWGDNMDFQSYMIACPDEKIGDVVMTNSSRGLRVAREIAAKALAAD